VALNQCCRSHRSPGISVAWLCRHRPRCQSPPSLKNGLPWSAARWAFIAGLNLIKNACRPDPRVVEHLSRRRQRLVQNSSSRSRSSGVNSIRARLSPTDPRAGCVWCHALGWVLMLLSPWSPHSSDVTTIRCPRLGVPRGGAGPDRGLPRHGDEPGRPRRLGFHGTVSARSCSGRGDAPSPNGDDFAPTASGPARRLRGRPGSRRPLAWRPSAPHRRGEADPAFVKEHQPGAASPRVFDGSWASRP
jgi:hypothetical protein